MNLNTNTKKQLATGLLILIILVLLWKIFMKKSGYGRKSGYDFYKAHNKE